MDDKTVTYHCSDCQGKVSPGESNCTHCGAQLEWDTPAEETKQQRVSLCLHCGARLAPDQGICPSCGAAQAEQPSRPVIAPMSLGDLFSRTVQLIGASFLRYLQIAAVMFVPLILLSILSGGLIFVMIALIFPAYLAGSIAVITITRGELYGTRLEWRDALAGGVRIYFWRALGQMLLTVIALAGTVIVIVIPLALIGSLSGTTLVVVPMIMLLFPALVYIGIRWSFTLSAIVCENTGVIESFRRSWHLVYGSWWRVFGILILMSLLTNFAIAIVGSPFSFAAFWGYYSEYFKALKAGGGVPDAAVLENAAHSLLTGVGITTTINVMLSTLVTPIYTTLLYFDLRARQGDFPVHIPDMVPGAEDVGQDKPPGDARQ